MWFLGFKGPLEVRPIHHHLEGHVRSELENRTRNTIRVNGSNATFTQLSTPTELQARALELINQRVPQIT